MKVVVHDRTEQFLSWWSGVQAQAKEMFAVAYRQFEHLIPRITQRGGLPRRSMEQLLKKVAALTGANLDVEVRVTLGPGFVNPMHYSMAQGGSVYLSFPSDYPYRQPKIVLTQWAAVALHHSAMIVSTQTPHPLPWTEDGV